MDTRRLPFIVPLCAGSSQPRPTKMYSLQVTCLDFAVGTVQRRDQASEVYVLG